ncbi:MAG: hypothetical protein ABSB15_03525 [Bryobacteraceae bacterium]
MLATAALLIAMYPDWVPARWKSGDPKSLDLLAHTPINCLWLERPQWSAALVAEASRLGIATLGVIRREGDPIEAARVLAKSGLTGGVIEGNFDDYSRLIVGGTLAKAKMVVLESGPRSRLHLDTDSSGIAYVPIVSTSQGMWPGIHVEKGGSANAGPTANPWIDTNTGFLRFARASTEAAVWMAVEPPPKTVYPVDRYVQAIGDAAINGGRWVVALDDDLWRRLLAGEPKTLKDWDRIGAALQHFEDHKEWRAATPAGQVAILEGYQAARFSGGLFDMLAAKHIPAFPIPYSKLNAAALGATRLAVDPDPADLPKQDAPVLQSFAQSGRVLVEGPPPGPEKPAPNDDDFVFDATDLRADLVWQKVSTALGRQNMGARLFNVASMLSNLLELHGQRQLVLHLVNYSDFPASGITARVIGDYRHARLFRPGEPPVDIETERVEDGTGFAIDERIVTIATVVLE